MGPHKLPCLRLSHSMLFVEVAPDVVLPCDCRAAGEPAWKTLRLLLCLGHVGFAVALVVSGFEVGVITELAFVPLLVVVPSHMASRRELVRASQ